MLTSTSVSAKVYSPAVLELWESWGWRALWRLLMDLLQSCSVQRSDPFLQLWAVLCTLNDI